LYKYDIIIIIIIIMIIFRHNIIELIETEKEYVKDLALIVEVKSKNIFDFLIFKYDLLGLYECY